MTSRHRAGYSLIEVMIALAILATSLTVLMGTVAHHSQQTVFSNRLTQSSLLARSKMTDLEYELMEEGFSYSDRSLRGDFRSEGHPEIKWEALIEPIEIPQEAQDAFLAQINSQLFGGMDTDGALQGNAAFSTMLPMLVGQLPQMINQIGQKVRRITLTVKFPYGNGEYPIVVMQYVVDQESKDFDMFGPSDGMDAP